MFVFIFCTKLIVIGPFFFISEAIIGLGYFFEDILCPRGLIFIGVKL